MTESYSAAKERLIEMGWSPEKADDIIDLMVNPKRIEEFTSGFATFMENRFPEGIHDHGRH